MLDWIFEGIIDWISNTVSSLMDAVSALFLDALGTDMTAMEEYFPFVSRAFQIFQYPKRGRPPRGARVTVRILGINRETNRIWGAITHVALAR